MKDQLLLIRSRLIGVKADCLRAQTDTFRRHYPLDDIKDALREIDDVLTQIDKLLGQTP